MSQKLYNPKSHAPALYISCWLSQVPTKLLSDGAKLTYGRLSQWCNESGKVFRSALQLAEELGKSERTIERHLKELRFVKLIGTYHPQAGGVNHFEFYDHPWMYNPINSQLVYKITPPDTTLNPPTNMSVPPDKYVGTPPTNMSDINKKEIKEIKTTTEQPPVVVPLTSSLTPNPQTKTQNNRDGITDKLLTAYRLNPIVKGNIMCEEDFLSAAYFSIDTRDKLTTTEQQRTNGICGLVRRGEFDEPTEWALNLIRKRNSQLGDANKALQEENMRSHAPILTQAKGRNENLKEIMAKIGKDKEETTKKPVYTQSTSKNIHNSSSITYKKLSLPEQLYPQTC